MSGRTKGRKPSVAAPAPGRWCAAALVVTRGGRYLMQHRDPFPWIHFPDHWCCFGGAVEPGETPRDTVLRELHEETGITARSATLFTELQAVYPFPEPRLDRVTFFTVPVAAQALDNVVVREGAGYALLDPTELAVMPNVVPLDLTAVMMHAYRKKLFRPPTDASEIAAETAP